MSGSMPAYISYTILVPDAKFYKIPSIIFETEDVDHDILSNLEKVSQSQIRRGGGWKPVC
jgi:hypothetical protein